MRTLMIATEDPYIQVALFQLFPVFSYQADVPTNFLGDIKSEKKKLTISEKNSMKVEEDVEVIYQDK